MMLENSKSITAPSSSTSTLMNVSFTTHTYEICYHQDGTVSYPNPAKFYDIRLTFDDGETIKKKAYPVEGIIQEYGQFLVGSDFSYLQSTFPQLISAELIEKRSEIKQQRNLARQSVFAIKMEAVLPRDSIARVVLEQSCYQSSPCQHHVLFYQHGEETPVVNKALNNLFSARDIAENYAEFLDVWDFMHIFKYIDSDRREKLISSKLNPILTSENMDRVHINRWKNTWSLFGKVTAFYDMTLYFRDGSCRRMDLLYDQEIVRYFGLYLDQKSFNSPELQSYITDELRTQHAARESDMKDFRDRQKAARFGLENIPDTSGYSEEADLLSLTPLMVAIIENQQSLVESLIADGADIHARSLLGSTAIMFAAQLGHFEMVKFLKEKGASLRDKNLPGWSVLNYAALSNHLPMVQWLLDEEEYIPSSAREINTTLFLACNKEEDFNINLTAFLYQRFWSEAGDFTAIANCAKNPWFKTKLRMSGVALQCAQIPAKIANNAIEELEIAYLKNEWLKRSLEALAEYASSSTLRQLQCRAIESTDIRNLSIFLNNSKHLEHLSFPSNEGLTPETAEELIKTLTDNSQCQLKSLRIHGSKIQKKGAFALANYLKTTTTLEVLKLEHCELDDQSVALIFEALYYNPGQLKTLILTCNQAKESSAYRIAELLSHPKCKLESLSLEGNHKLGKSLFLIFKALHNNKSLKKLNCRYCGFESEMDVQSIIELIRYNRTLTTLSVGGKLDSLNVERIINSLSLSSNSVLQYLEFDVTTSNLKEPDDVIKTATRLFGEAVECDAQMFSCVKGIGTWTCGFTIDQAKKQQLAKSMASNVNEPAPSSSIGFFQGIPICSSSNLQSNQPLQKPEV